MSNWLRGFALFAVFIAAVRSQDLHSQIAGDLSDFSSSNWKDRERAFNDLGDVGCPRCNNSQYPVVDGIDNARRRSPVDADDIVTSLIALLQTENGYAKTQASLTEEYTDYWGDLSMVVGNFRDPRSLDALYGVIEHSGVAEDSLATLGDAALNKLLASLTSNVPEDIEKRPFVMNVIGKMAHERNLKNFADPGSSRSIIKAKLLDGLTRSDPSVRTFALSGLVNLGDKDVIPQIKPIAQSNSYVDEHGSFLVRKHAQDTLAALSAR